MIIKLEGYSSWNHKENKPAQREITVEADDEGTGLVVLGIDVEDTNTRESWCLSTEEAFELGAALKFWAGHQERKFR